MASYDWKIQKEKHLEQLKNAGISPKSEFGKLYLRFCRRVNTCWNRMGSGSERAWESMCYSDAYNEASDLLDRFNGGGYLKEEAEFWNEWQKLAEANGICKGATLGDHLC